MTLEDQILKETSKANKAIGWLKSKSNGNEQLLEYLKDLESFVNSYKHLLVENRLLEKKEGNMRIRLAKIIADYELLRDGYTDLEMENNALKKKYAD